MTIETLETLAKGTKVVTNKGAVLTVTMSERRTTYLGNDKPYTRIQLTPENGKPIVFCSTDKIAQHLAPQMEVA
jgi:hypothetical protein